MREREQRMEIDNIIAISNATKNMNPPPQAPAGNSYTPPANNGGCAGTVSFCPKCGTRITQSAVFCPNCGKKL
jgi:membrane protease subunit (stomatin/prohibitin family)